jgi:hypothetical protein
MLGMIKRQGSKLIVAFLKAIPTKIQHLPHNSHQRRNIRVVRITVRIVPLQYTSVRTCADALVGCWTSMDRVTKALTM